MRSSNRFLRGFLLRSAWVFASSDVGLRPSGLRLRDFGAGLRHSGVGLRTSGPGLRGFGAGAEILASNFAFLRLGFEVLGGNAKPDRSASPTFHAPCSLALHWASHLRGGNAKPKGERSAKRGGKG